MVLTLNAVNLIQAATISVALLGCVLFWQRSAFRGVVWLLAYIAFASAVNIAEESGITKDIYLLSPALLLISGPAFFVVAKSLTGRMVSTLDSIHFVPALVALPFTANVQTIILLGTFSRVLYSIYTIKVLFEYKRSLEQERSDADEFSFTWLIWVVVTITAFTAIDLVRLNIQQLLAVDLNLLGQGINNLIWLLLVAYVIVKLHQRVLSPVPQIDSTASLADAAESSEDYRAIFAEVDQQIKVNAWFRRARLTLNELSELTGFQARDISRAINLVGKCSFNDYINGLRVGLVCEHIRQSTDQTITNTMLDSGFSSKATFNKAFKQVMGMTPSEYKAMQQGTGS
ncbi:helix-turn-helix domain-containing protein [Alteromonas facilis]|uniref:helix-turn-helix domain-containing protein n=1 Tax=Alteromonas facilis TaxID=2048004 RepID=UPI000C28A5F1|nr:helix-turn-helix domain-containing protein [Alteromonas facilis]